MMEKRNAAVEATRETEKDKEKEKKLQIIN
jgi:hypothetical protein